MTAYTYANVSKVFLKQEGELKSVVLKMTRLDTGDTLDLTPWVNGGKVINLKAVDHAATVTGPFATPITAGGTVSAGSMFNTSMVVSTDVVTFTGVTSSTDAYISFDVVPS